MPVDETKFQDFLSAVCVGAEEHVLLGDRLGLYRALALGPATPGELAARTGTYEHDILDWLHAQVAGGYVAYDQTADRFLLTADQELAPFQVAAAIFKHAPRATAAFRV